MKDSRNLLWILPVAAILTLPLWKPLAADFLRPARNGRASPVPALTGGSVLKDSEMSHVYFEQSKNGIKEWLLTADRLFSTVDNSDMQLEGVEAQFFGTPGEHEETQIRSRRARYNADTRKLILQGEVVVQNRRGYEMQTESLEYVAADNNIRSTAGVSVKGGNIEVSGKELLYDTVTGDYILTSNVVCRVW